MADKTKNDKGTTTATAPPLAPPTAGNGEKPKESKRDRFIRLAVKRVTKACTMVLRVGNLASKSQYEYGAADVERIMSALGGAVNTVKGRFAGTSGGPTFTL